MPDVNRYDPMTVQTNTSRAKEAVSKAPWMDIVLTTGIVAAGVIGIAAAFHAFPHVNAIGQKGIEAGAIGGGAGFVIGEIAWRVANQKPKISNEALFQDHLKKQIALLKKGDHTNDSFRLSVDNAAKEMNTSGTFTSPIGGKFNEELVYKNGVRQ